MGGKRSTSFKKGEGGRPEGAKNIRTRVKEALGIKNWDELKSFVENEGIERCIQQLQSMKGANYVYAYLALTEYVKPKLQRTTHAGDPDNPIMHKLTIENIENVPTEKLLELLDGRAAK